MKFLITCLAFLSMLNAFAGSKIEAWKNGEGIKFVVRDEQGKFLTHGELTVESWNDGDNTSEWVARRADGTFVSGYRGKLEKFKVKAGIKEQLRLVIRNTRGQLVTWKAADEFLTAGFEGMDLNRDGKAETVYVIRYNGKFVNWAKARIEKWSNLKMPVLVVRDSQDGSANGQLLAWIAAEKMSNGKLAFRDPETGRFVSHNR